MKNYKIHPVVALLLFASIIAILAVIATPNFLEAQTRSKRSRLLADMRAAHIQQMIAGEANTESYSYIPENKFASVLNSPLSTFSIDVDTASYANTRRFITQGELPPVDAVRIEELINYFDYEYPDPKDDAPFALHADYSVCPWNPAHLLARIALKARNIEWAERPSCNLIFLLDTSGSMDDPFKLPLVKRSLKLLAEHLSANDRIAIVTYAGCTGVALESTACDNARPIVDALDRLDANGSTNGASGIQLAYDMAQKYFTQGGLNRVILCTDGDFNVGITDEGSLVRLIETKAKSGISLSVFGYGMGNLKDSTLEKLADHGNGNYAYVDSINEARKVLVEQISGTLMTLAKDTKIQVEFNPSQISEYRLIGYEDRMLSAADFKDDTKDAGDLGAGQTVTALYELVPPGAERISGSIDPLKYSKSTLQTDSTTSELLTVKVRYKLPEKLQSIEMRTVLVRSDAPNFADDEFKFAAAVAMWGMLLRHSAFSGQATPQMVLDLSKASIGHDPHGYRHEFISLVSRACDLMTARSEIKNPKA